MLNEASRKRHRIPVAIGTALALAGGAIAAFPSAVSAQSVPTASAEAVCVEDEGAIRVVIEDEASYTYIVVIDEELVAEDITDTDGSYIEFGPLENGVYNVLVGWNQNEEYILDTDVTVDCTPEVTTTVAPTTTAVAVADATVTAPAFTG